MPCKPILVVDHDENVRNSYSMILRGSGYRVACASSAGHAVKLLTGADFSLICLDVLVPDMDILTFLAVVRAIKPGMPGLIISAWPYAGDLVAECPANWFTMMKPADPALMLEQVRRLLNQAASVSK
jgi:DNA-binding NtrC family response regulator